MQISVITLSETTHKIVCIEVNKRIIYKLAQVEIYIQDVRVFDMQFSGVY